MSGSTPYTFEFLSLPRIFAEVVSATVLLGSFTFWLGYRLWRRSGKRGRLYVATAAACSCAVVLSLVFAFIFTSGAVALTVEREKIVVHYLWPKPPKVVEIGSVHAVEYEVVSEGRVGRPDVSRLLLMTNNGAVTIQPYGDGRSNGEKLITATSVIREAADLQP